MSTAAAPPPGTTASRLPLVALAVLLLSYTQPSMVLHDAPLRMVVALNALHTVAAALTVWMLGRTEP
jgi:hypothetical protein